MMTLINRMLEFPEFTAFVIVYTYIIWTFRSTIMPIFGLINVVALSIFFLTLVWILMSPYLMDPAYLHMHDHILLLSFITLLIYWLWVIRSILIPRFGLFTTFIWNSIVFTLILTLISPYMDYIAIDRIFYAAKCLGWFIKYYIFKILSFLKIIIIWTISMIVMVVVLNAFLKSLQTLYNMLEFFYVGIINYILGVPEDSQHRLIFVVLCAIYILHRICYLFFGGF